MENKIVNYRDYRDFGDYKGYSILGFYRDNGEENGNYYNGVIWGLRVLGV